MLEFEYETHTQYSDVLLHEGRFQSDIQCSVVFILSTCFHLHDEFIMYAYSQKIGKSSNLMVSGSK